jgi:murein DD-endopeptidase MepM/ murein hydrolase activator NlpD
MRWTCLRLTALFGFAASLMASDTARVPLADGFEIPLARDGKNYYKSRGVRPNGHLGEDWNGAGGGDTDLGDPICATADGIVVFAQNYHLGWGNVVITRHAYTEGDEVKYVDALYGHLLDFSVQLGQFVKRGQQIGRMGNNFGMYDAHLHFEMRKNLDVGMHRNSFPRDWSVYWSPTEFIATHGTLPGGGRVVSVPVNTFSEKPPPVLAGAHIYTPSVGPTRAGTAVVDGSLVSRDGRTPLVSNIYGEGPRVETQPRPTTPIRREPFHVDRYEDMRKPIRP